MVMWGVLCSYYRTISNSSQVYLNQLKARMLWLLAHIYLLLSTGIKLLLGGISGGTIVGCIILNAFKILNVSGSFLFFYPFDFSIF